MKNINKPSESGETRRYWRNFAKEYNCGANIKVGAFNDACHITRNRIKRNDLKDWKKTILSLLRIAKYN